MSFSVCFIERRDRDSPSIERVFRCVAAEIQKKGVSTTFIQVPYGNGVLGTLLNLIFFRPPTADIYHVTGHVNFLGLVLPKRKTVLTLHDLTILDHRSGLRRWLIERLYFSWPMRRLKYLTAISESTKTKMLRTAGIQSEKVSVVGNPLLVSRSEGRPFDGAKPTILQIGTAPNKNIGRLVEAVSAFPCRLHIVGKPSSELRSRISDLGVEVLHHELLDDAGIEQAYEEADIVAICSTDEGFGLPIIEAQAKGTLVITSDCAPMNDVAGGGAVLVDPHDVGSIRKGVESIIGDPELRSKLRRSGFDNLNRFEPESIAAQYLRVYESILKEN